MVEKCLNVHGDEILYVGDHIYTDVSQSKVHLRWRTALICRELEDEVIHMNFYLRLLGIMVYRIVLANFLPISYHNTLCKLYAVGKRDR